jgi:hypothetical protein
VAVAVALTRSGLTVADPRWERLCVFTCAHALLSAAVYSTFDAVGRVVIVPPGRGGPCMASRIRAGELPNRTGELPLPRACSRSGAGS